MSKKRRGRFVKIGLKALTLGVAVMLLSFVSAPVFAAPDILVDKSGIENYDGGRIPAGLDASYYTYPQDVNVRMPRMALPEKYDLRDAETNGFGKNMVTSVKDQDPWGSCWAFGGNSSVESNAIVNGASDTIDISERYLAWFAYQKSHGEGYEVVEGLDKVLDFGGRRQMSTADYASWQGPVAETVAPWQNNAGGLEKGGDWSLAVALREETPEVHVQNVDYLPECAIFDKIEKNTRDGYHLDANAMVTIKQTLMEKGVLDASYYSAKSLPGQVEDPNSQILNLETNAQYCPEYVAPNHEISVVGWDDSFSADNFKIVPKDEAGESLNGAWIIKNSWGPGEPGKSGIDEEGYMYISYYDQTITEFSAYQVDVEEDGMYSYDNNYQYDYLGMKSVVSAPPSLKATGNKIANVFTAEKDEILEAVSAVTVDVDSTVTIEIYKNPAGAAVPSEGELVSTQESNVPFGGYHTLELETPVALKAEERFSVVLSIVGDSGTYIPFEIGLDFALSPCDGGSIKTSVKIEKGESFVYDASEGWSDIQASTVEEGISFGNAMIKAFTVDQDPAVSVSLVAESFDKADKSLGSQTITDLSAPIVLPETTESITLKKTAENGTAVLSLNGEDYEEGTKISRAIFETPGAIVMNSFSIGRGNNDKQYTLSFKVKTVIVEEEVPVPTPINETKGTTETGKNASTGIIENEENAAFISAGLLVLLIGGCMVLKKKNSVN